MDNTGVTLLLLIVRYIAIRIINHMILLTNIKNYKAVNNLV
jgi:hypothetical protein